MTTQQAKTQAAEYRKAAVQYAADGNKTAAEALERLAYSIDAVIASQA